MVFDDFSYVIEPFIALSECCHLSQSKGNGTRMRGLAWLEISTLPNSKPRALWSGLAAALPRSSLDWNKSFRFFADDRA
jgi:hypothetical protein